MIEAVSRTHADRWSANQARKANGQREISPPKRYGAAYPKLNSIRLYQDNAYSAHSLAHNIKRRPKRRVRR